MSLQMQPNLPKEELQRPRLFTVVLNWNGMEDLMECLRSGKGSTYHNEIIVVDNGSTDGSVTALAQQFPDVLVIETGENLGFGANNLGISQALQRGADYVLLLNNDTWVDARCFDRLIQVAEENPQVGILSPRICYYSDPELIWYDGGNLERVNGFWKHQHVNENSRVASVSDEAREVDYICGCAMLIRREVIEHIGGLNSRFFMYWEDGDFSLRARNAGFRLLHVPSAIVLHKVSRSIGGSESPDVLYYMERNRYFFSARGMGIRYFGGLLKAQVRRCLWTYHDLMEVHKNDQALAVAEAGWDSLIGRSGKRRGRLPSMVLRWLEKRRRPKGVVSC
jgi:GT2 family glycosyltransferase